MYYKRSHPYGSGFIVESDEQDLLPLATAGEIWAQPAWPITWHKNPGWELYFQATGQSDWQINQDQVRVPEQGAYLIRGGEDHRLISFLSASSHYYFVVFNDDQIPGALVSQACWQESYTIFNNASELLLPFQGLIQELSVNAPWSDLGCRAYIQALCTLCVRLSSTQPYPPSEKPRHPALERAIRLMRGRLDHPWSLQELSRLSWVSSSYLITLFRDAYGQPPMRHLTTLRMAEARRQLQSTQRTLTEIAIDCGFSSTQHMSKVCRNQYQCSPTQLRHSA